MTNYLKSTDFASKDALLAGNPSKVVKGVEINTEFDNIAAADATSLKSGGALGTPSSGTVTNLTGTASININGTVGATTPAAVNATTVSATGAVSVSAGTNSNIKEGTGWIWTSTGLSGGTIRGGAYAQAGGDLNLFGGASITSHLKIDASGNVGIGVTPSASWASGTKVLQIGPSTSLFNPNSASYSVLATNAVFTTGVSVSTYQNTAGAAYYAQNSGVHYWYTAPSGTAGNPITFTERMNLSSTGLAVTGTLSATGVTTLNAVATVTAPDAAYQFGVKGTTKGLRIGTSPTGATVEGVDTTLVGSYQPLQLMGSSVTIVDSTSTGRVVVTSSGAAVTGTLSASGTISQGGTAVVAVAPSTSGNVLTSNGAAWVSSPAASGSLAVSVVSGTTQTAVAGNHYILTNVAASTVTLPASPTSGDMVWVTWTNSLDTNVIARNGQTIMGLSEDMTLNASTNGTVQLRFVNSSWRIL